MQHVLALPHGAEQPQGESQEAYDMVAATGAVQQWLHSVHSSAVACVGVLRGLKNEVNAGYVAVIIVALS